MKTLSLPNFIFHSQKHLAKPHLLSSFSMGLAWLSLAVADEIGCVSATDNMATTALLVDIGIYGSTVAAGVNAVSEYDAESDYSQKDEETELII